MDQYQSRKRVRGVGEEGGVVRREGLRLEGRVIQSPWGQLVRIFWCSLTSSGKLLTNFQHHWSIQISLKTRQRGHWSIRISPEIHMDQCLPNLSESSGLHRYRSTSADCKRGRRKGATSKNVKKYFDTSRQFSRRAKNVKNRQKVSKTLFDSFRAAPFFRPLFGGL